MASRCTIMPRRLRTVTASLLPLLLLAGTAWCDWHHHGGGSGGGDPGPEFKAFFWASTAIIGGSVVLLLLGRPIFVTRVRRIRDLFWVVPLLNTAVYLVTIAFQEYPGGFAARFRPPGSENTALEIALLVLCSLLVATVHAAIQWSVLKVKGVAGRLRSEPEEARPSAEP